MQDYASQINALTEFVKVLWKEMANIKKSQAATLEMYPFRIYSPPAWTYNPPSTDNTSWRSFRIRSGYVLTSLVVTQSVFGTDGYKWADRQTYPFPVTDNLYTVPISQSSYWFWIEKPQTYLGDATGSYIIRYGENPKVVSTGNPTPWTTFPSASATHIPIGFVDTYTSGSIQQSYVRQLLRTDVISTGGNYISMSVCVDEKIETWFVDAFKSGSSP